MDGIKPMIEKLTGNELKRIFAETGFGFSKSLEKECLYRMEQGELLQDILKQVNESESLYLYSKDYHLIPLTHIKEEPKILPWDEGLETFYKSIQIQAKRTDKTKELLLIAKKEIKKYSNKISKLEVELEKSENSEIYKEYGDILFTYCENLKTIYIDPTLWKTSQVVGSLNMFGYCYSLVGGAGTIYNDNIIDNFNEITSFEINN